jgi:hypothetical protein
MRAGQPPFGPISDIQGKSLSDYSAIKNFFVILASQFGGDVEKVDVSKIVDRTNSTEIEQEVISDWLIKQRLDEFFQNHLGDYKQNRKLQENSAFGWPKAKNNVFTGWAVSYDELDRNYSFPKGTFKKYETLLIEIADSYGLEQLEKNESGVKFKNVRKR